MLLILRHEFCYSSFSQNPEKKPWRNWAHISRLKSSENGLDNVEDSVNCQVQQNKDNPQCGI